jgi:hypothetical protein
MENRLNLPLYLLQVLKTGRPSVEEGITFLPKPFCPQALAKLVRQLPDENGVVTKKTAYASDQD